MERVTFFIVVSLLLVQPAGSEVIVNSGSWRHTFTALGFAGIQGNETVLVQNPGDAKMALKMLDRGQKHLLLTSRSAPGYQGLAAVFRRRGFKIRKVTLNDSSQYLLAERLQVEGYLVVPGKFGRSAVTAFPKVLRDDYFLLFQDDRTTRFLRKEEAPAIYVGLKPPEGVIPAGVVDEGGPGRTNRRFISRYLSGSSTVSVTDRGRIDKQALMAGYPVLLEAGPVKLADFIESQGFRVVQVLGSSNGGLARRLASLTDSDVVLKAGRAFTGAIEGRYPLKYIDLPSRNWDMRMEEVLYDSESGELSVEFSNRGNVSSSVVIKDFRLETGNRSIDLASRSVELEPGGTIRMIYGIGKNLSIDSADITAVSSGKRLTGGNGLSPQPVYPAEIHPPTRLETVSIEAEEGKVAVRVENRGGEAVYARLFGTEEIISSREKFIPPGETRTFTLETGSSSDVMLAYGPSTGSYTYTEEVEPREGGGNLLLAVTVLTILLAPGLFRHLGRASSSWSFLK